MQPHPYQLEGIKFLRDQGRALLADEPGLGKTMQALQAVQGRTLVVGPAMLEGTWAEEAALWRPGLDVSFVSYSSLCERAPDAKGRNSRSLPRPRKHLLGDWDTLVLDEVHHAKSRSTAWTKAVLALSKRSQRVYELTGTPVPNWSHEIYMPLRLLRPDDPDLTNYWKWLQRWFAVWKPKWGGTKVLGLRKGVTWEKFVVGNSLDACMLRRLRDDVLKELPPLTEQTIEVAMVPSQAAVYKRLKADYMAEMPSGQRQVAWSDGGLHTKLAQCSTGLEVLDPQSRGSAKINTVAELIADREGQPLVLFCVFRETARQVAQVASAWGRKTQIVMGGMKQADRDSARRQFQAGEIDCLIGTLDTISEGWTLTAADTCIFVEHSWRPSRNEQALRRLHRIGQTRPVSAIHLITAGTVDARMQPVLAKKTDDQVAMMTAAAFARLL